jgi:mycofactocin system creatininase family protein
MLAQETWPRIPTRPLVIVPIGSTEQHGPHLPFSTDSLVATAVASGVAARLSAAGRSVVVAPTVPYGASGEHQDFPGTSSIGHDVLAVLVVELIRSLSTWASDVLIVNGHGGNVAALASAVPRMIGEGHRVSWVPCTSVDGDAHAGRTETSLMMHLHPDLVNVSALVPGNAEPIGSLLPRLRSEGVRAVSPTGVLGDPSGASSQEGARVLTEMVSTVWSRFNDGLVDAHGSLTDSGAAP